MTPNHEIEATVPFGQEDLPIPTNAGVRRAKGSNRWQSTSKAAGFFLAGASLSLFAACSPAAEQATGIEISVPQAQAGTVTEALKGNEDDPTRYTLIPSVSKDGQRGHTRIDTLTGKEEFIPGNFGNTDAGQEVSRQAENVLAQKAATATAIPFATATVGISPTNTPEAKPSSTAQAKEVEQKTGCDIFGDPKYCDLVDIFQTTLPSKKVSTSANIRKPSDNNPIEIVAPFSGYFQTSSDKHIATLSSNKGSINGFIFNGNFSFIEVTEAEGKPVTKGQPIGLLQDKGYRLKSKPDSYIANILSQKMDENGNFLNPIELLQEHFPIAFNKPPVNYTTVPIISATPKSIYGGGVIIIDPEKK